MHYHPDLLFGYLPFLHLRYSIKVVFLFPKLYPLEQWFSICAVQITPASQEGIL